MTETIESMEERANRAARAHTGETAWPTTVLGGVCFVAFGANLLLAGLSIIPLWLAFVVMVVLVYASYTIVHEAVHGSINGKNRSLLWLNDLMGFAGAQLIGASFVAHRKEHLAHHRATNKPGADPDLDLFGGSLFTVLKGTLKALPMQIQFYLEHHWRQAPLRERALFVAEYIVMIAWRVAFVFLAGWQTALALLVVATLLGIFITLLGFAWIVHRPFDAVGRYKDTATIVFPQPLDTIISWLWLFQNYHSIHHLFPRVPFYRYRQVFSQIEEVMKANGAPIFRVSGLLVPIRAGYPH